MSRIFIHCWLFDSPQRSRMLSTLYKDDRVKESPSLRPHYSVLEKMFNEKILRKSEVEYFKENCLSSHQVAVKTADGSTVLEKAVMVYIGIFLF